MTQFDIQRARVQYISHFNNSIDYFNGCLKALEGGCKWIQIRMKDSSDEQVEQVVLKLKPVCKEYEAVLVIDDRVQLCKKLQLDGVHLGKNDMHPSEARKLLGEQAIIGGTCNSFQDVLRISEWVDYIGCGPFRFTQTKQKLAPVLGLEGYQQITWQMREANINIPIVAIGGITVNDISSILSSGPNGIALSGEILNASDPVAKMQEVMNVIYSQL